MKAEEKALIKEQQSLMRHDQTGYRTTTIEAAKSASEALSKVSPDEATAYEEWVLAIGRKVAEAAKEGGAAVSDPEKAVLSEIAGAFGISAQVPA